MRESFPWPKEKSNGARVCGTYTSHRCLCICLVGRSIVSCLQKEAAIRGQVLSRVPDSRVQTTLSCKESAQKSLAKAITSLQLSFSPSPSANSLIQRFIFGYIKTIIQQCSPLTPTPHKKKNWSVFVCFFGKPAPGRLWRNVGDLTSDPIRRTHQMSVASMNMPHHLFSGYPFQGTKRPVFILKVEHNLFAYISSDTLQTV